MDYRERKYYLVRISDYNENIKFLKQEIPSLKFNKPYNHFTNKNKAFKIMSKNKSVIYDSDIIRPFVQQLVSCRKEDSEKFESLFKIITVPNYSFIKEFTKEDFGQ